MALEQFTVRGMSVEELREEMLDLCAKIARNAKVKPNASVRVGAARTVLDHLPDEEPLDVLVKLLGDEQAALSWLETALTTMRARIEARRPRQLVQAEPEGA